MGKTVKSCNRHGHKYFLECEIHGSNPRGGRSEFTVRLFYRDAQSGSEESVACIRRQSGTTVFAKYFKKPQQKVQSTLDYWSAIQKIDTHWKNYADKYENNHNP